MRQTPQRMQAFAVAVNGRLLARRRLSALQYVAFFLAEDRKSWCENMPFPA